MALRRPFRSLLPFLLLPACATHGPRTAPSTAPPNAAFETIHVRTSEGTGLAFDLSRDGRWIVFDLLGQLWRTPAGGGAAEPLTDAVRDTAEDREPSFAPDGRIAFRGERRGRQGLWLLEPDGNVRQLTQLADPDGFDGSVDWSPDGRTIAFTRLVPPDSGPGRPRPVIALLDPATRTVRLLRLPAAVGARAQEPAWHPDGRRLAVVAARAGRTGRLWLVDTTGTEAVALTDSAMPAARPAISPTGDRVAFFAADADGRSQVWIRDLASPSSPRRVTSHRDITPTSIAWTPDGSRVLYGADGALWSVAATGGSPTRIPFSAELALRRPLRELAPARFAHPGTPQPARGFMGLALSPDGRRIGLIALGELWVMEVGGEPRRVARLPESARYLTWSPDGLSVAWSAGRFEQEDLFATEVATGATRRVTTLPGREVFPAWSPDGEWIAFVHSAQGGAPRLRLVGARATAISDTTGARDLGEVGLEWTGTAAFAPVWSPDARALLVPAPNYDAAAPERADIVRLDGSRRTVELAASPIFAQWVPGSLVYVRHAKLWRLPFDSTGPRGAPESLGDDAALFPSVSTGGDILYMSDQGLRLRGGATVRQIGWPIRYTPPVREPLLISNVRLIDGKGTPASAPKDVLVESGRIARIEPAGSLPARGTRLDAANGYLMPGLIDLHAHQYVNELLPGFLYFGITTLRDQGAPIGPLVSYADAVAAGVFPGPRIAYGGFQFYSDWYFDAEDGHGIEPEADSAHVRRAIALAEGFGAQHVKTRTFRRWDINARMVEEAHRRGMRVTGHCAHLLALVAAGFDTKEHAGFCNGDEVSPTYDDRVQLYRAAGIGFVPTIIYTSLAARLDRPDHFAGDVELAAFMLPITSDDWMLGLDAGGRRRMAEIASVSRATTLRMARAGVVVGTGTDVWQVPTGIHMELEELVAAGLTPLEAIRAATGDAARILGAAGELGTVEVGKRADLVLLDADPTSDIRNTRRIRAVIQDGAVVDRAELLRRYRIASP